MKSDSSIQEQNRPFSLLAISNKRQYQSWALSRYSAIGRSTQIETPSPVFAEVRSNSNDSRYSRTSRELQHTRDQVSRQAHRSQGHRSVALREVDSSRFRRLTNRLKCPSAVSVDRPHPHAE